MLFWCSSLIALVPSQLAYQGKLTDASGTPIQGSVSTTFRIYNVATGGSAVWTESKSISITNGYFSTALGSINPLSSTVFNGGAKYLGIQIASDAEMSPRVPLLSTPYAFSASGIDISGNNNTFQIRPFSMSSGEYAQVAFVDPDGSTPTVNIRFTDNGVPALGVIGGRLGVGTATPQKQFHVVGDALISTDLSVGTNLRVTGNLNVTGVTNVGTITAGVWNGTAIAVANGGTGSTTAFTLGSVPFAGASGVYSQNNANLFWDNTNLRLGIGTATPARPLSFQDIVGDKISLFGQIAGAAHYGFGVQSYLFQIYTDTSIADIAFGYGRSAAFTETVRFKGTGGFQLKGPSNLGIDVGQGRTTDAWAYIDLIGDSTYTDYGLRLFRGPGANAESWLQHRGTGTLRITAEDAGSIILMTNLVTRMTIGSTGTVTVPGSLSLGTITAGVWNGTAIALNYIAANAVDSSKIVDASITSADIGLAQIKTPHLLNANVTLAKLAANSVDSSKIVDASITSADIAASTITNTNLAAGTFSNITGVGTITAGVWNGTAIAVANGGTGSTTAFTLGSVPFAGASGVYSQNNANLFWDNTNLRLGIGTATPARPLSFSDVTGDKISLYGQGAGAANYGFGIQSYLFQIYTSANTADIAFGYGSSAAFTETVRFKGTGKVGIGTASPAASLTVSGNALIGTGDSAIRSSRGLTVAINNSSTYTANSDIGDVNRHLTLINTNDVTNGYSSLSLRAGSTSPEMMDMKLTKTGVSSGNLIFTLNNSAGFFDVMTLTSAGNVGIGTATPMRPLSFPDASGAKISLWGQTAGAAHSGFGTQPYLLQIYTDVVGADIAFGYGSSAAFTETVRFKGTGKVGIGTASPTAPLHVTALGGNPDVNGIFNFNPTNTAGQHAIIATRVAGAAAGDPFFSMDISGVVGWAMGVKNDNSGVAANQNFQIANTWNSLANPKMTITPAGNVGIGTATPMRPLSFSNTLGDKISLWGQVAGENFGFGIQNNLLQMYTNNSSSDIAFGYGSSAAFTETVRIKGSGRVGIGITAPTGILEVAGAGSGAWVILKNNVGGFNPPAAIGGALYMGWNKYLGNRDANFAWDTSVGTPKMIFSTWDGTTYTDRMSIGPTGIVTVPGSLSLGTITSGIWNGTVIAVADGGTGASTTANARANLGLTIGSQVQSYSASLAQISGLAATAGNVIVGNGTTWISQPNTSGVADGSVTLAKLAANSVDTSKIVDASIGGVDIAANSITSTHITDNSIGSSDILIDTILAVDIAAGAVATSEILDGTIINADLSAGLFPNITGIGTITAGVWNGTAIALANGGTGSTTAAGARANLSAAASGANADITSLTGLTTVEVAGEVRIRDANVLNFGSNVTKENSAGKIGYQTFTAGALDIVGAGTTGIPRIVKLWDNVTVGGILTVGNPTATRTNLGAAASGANADITSLTGLTTALSLTQGGTGATSASAARTSLGLGSIALLNTISSANIGTGQVTSSNIGIAQVKTPHLLDANVTLAKLALDSVDSSKILIDTILAVDIAAGAVGTSEILDGTIAGADIAASTITNTNLAAGTFSNITGVGTITAGVWNGTAIAVASGGTGSTTAFTTGSVPFAGASGVYSQNNANLFWDNTNLRLGIGTATPMRPLSFPDASGAKISLWGQTAGAAHSGFGTQPYLLQIYTDVVGADIAFGYGSSAAFTETVRFKGTGRVGIGITAPTGILEVAGAGSGAWVILKNNVGGFNPPAAIGGALYMGWNKYSGNRDANFAWDTSVGTPKMIFSTWDGTTYTDRMSIGPTGIVTVPGSLSLGTITAGVWNGTAIAVLNGGTGASTTANARANLGLTIGSQVQSYSASLAQISGLAATAGNVIVGDGTTWISQPNTSGVADGSVTLAKLAANAVDSSKILDNSIGTLDILLDTILAVDIAVGAVGTSEILDANVTLAKLAANSVDSSKIVDASIAGADIAASIITSTHILDGTIASADIGLAQIKTPHILDANVTLAKLAANSVDASKILDNSIGTLDILLDTILAVDIAVGAVGTSEILDGTILAVDIAAGAVGTSEILDGTIINADLSAGLFPNIIGVGTLTGPLLAHGGIRMINSFDPSSLTQFIGDPGAYISFGDTGSSEDFIGYKAHTFYFRDSPGGGESYHPSLDVGGNVIVSGNVIVTGNMSIAGMITKGIWNGTAIAVANGGTGATTAAAARANLEIVPGMTVNPLPVINGGTGTLTAFTLGSVPFAGASGVYSQNNANLFWDNTNARLGIGTATPARPLSFQNSYGDKISLFSQTAGANYGFGIQDYLLQIYTQTQDGSIAFGFGSSAVALFTETVRITGTGRVGIGTAAPREDLDLGGALGTTGGNMILGTYSGTVSRYLGIGSGSTGAFGTNSGFSGLEFGGPALVGGEGYLAFHVHDHSGVVNPAWAPVYLGSREAMRIALNRNVGIGTTTPARPLSFSNDLGAKISLWGQDATHYGFGIQSTSLQIYTAANTSNIVFGFGSSAALTETARITGDGDISSVRDMVAGRNAMAYGDISTLKDFFVAGKAIVIGNVGIGTATPARPLSFASTLGAKISLWGQGDTHYGFGIQSTSLQIYTAANTSDIVFGHGSTGILGSLIETVRITGMGQVGIGTTTPKEDLDLGGALGTTGGNMILGTYSGTVSRYLGIGSGTAGLFGTNSGFSGLEFGGPALVGGEGYLAFHVHDHALVANPAWAPVYLGSSEAMRIALNRNVGIGTTTPARPLSFPDTYGDKISLWGQTAGAGNYGFGIQAGVLQIYTSLSTADIVFGYGYSTGFTETVRFKGTGRVGIGTTTPQAQLGVAGTITAGGSTAFTGTSGQGAYFGWSRLATGATVFANQQGLGSGGWEWVPYSNTNVLGTVAMTLSQAGNLAVAGALTVGTRTTYSEKTASDLAVYGEIGYKDPSGVSHSMIAFGDPVASGAIPRPAWVNGLPANTPYIQFNVPVVFAKGGYIHDNYYLMTDISLYMPLTSDERFKKNINPLSNALAKVMKLEGVTYQFRTDEFKDRNFPTTQQIGVIAQDIEKEYPELVTKDSKGYYKVNYGAIAPILIEAIKELKALVEQQATQIDQQNQRIQDLEKLMAPK